jgi:hypothetical protein
MRLEVVCCDRGTGTGRLRQSLSRLEQPYPRHGARAGGALVASLVVFCQHHASRMVLPSSARGAPRRVGAIPRAGALSNRGFVRTLGALSAYRPNGRLTGETPLPRWASMGEADDRNFDRHPHASISSIIPAQRCPRCRMMGLCNGRSHRRPARYVDLQLVPVFEGNASRRHCRLVGGFLRLIRPHGRAVVADAPAAFIGMTL